MEKKEKQQLPQPLPSLFSGKARSRSKQQVRRSLFRVRLEQARYQTYARENRRLVACSASFDTSPDCRSGGTSSSQSDPFRHT